MDVCLKDEQPRPLNLVLHPSARPALHPFIPPLICFLFLPSLHNSMHPSLLGYKCISVLHPFVPPSIHPAVLDSIHLSIRPSLPLLSLHHSSPPFIFPFFTPSFTPYIHPFIPPSTPPYLPSLHHHSFFIPSIILYISLFIHSSLYPSP